jgi:oligopeptide transport system substrate-binding protein
VKAWRDLLGLVCASALVACGLPDTPYFGHVPEVTDPRHLRYCNQGEPEDLDPTMAATTTAVRLVHQMFDGLLVYDLDGKPVPGLASSWTTSEDLRTFTFTLRHNARWSNGRTLDAYDLGYQVMRVLHPSTASGNASNAPTIKGASGFSARRLAVLRRDAGAYRAGQVVEIERIDGRPFEDHSAGSRPNPNLRSSSQPLRLRDLDAKETLAYATVRPGTRVEVVAVSNSNLMPPARDGRSWSYVFWDAGEGLYGWVPSEQLDRQPFATTRFTVRRVARKDTPGSPSASAVEITADAAQPRPPAEVTGADLTLATEVLGVRVLDRFTIEFENAYPTPYFPFIAANRALRPTPIEAVSRRPRRWATPEFIVTSGPMHLTVWKERDYVEMRRSPTYWNPLEVKLDVLTAYSFDDAAASANYYFSGRCDAVATNQIPATYLPALNGERRHGKPYLDFTVRPFLSSYFVLINVAKFRNVHLRRALNFAVDRRRIPMFTHGGEHPTAQLTPGATIASLSDAERTLCGVGPHSDPQSVAMIMVPGELCYVAPPGLNYDLQRATAELAIARREMGAAFPRRLSYRYNAGSEVHKLIAEYLQQQWQQVGLEVELLAQEWKTLVVDTAQGNYELARFGNAATFPNPEVEYLELFACGSSFNRSQYCNLQYDQMLDDIRSTADPQQRNRKTFRAEQMIVQDAVVIPLYVYTQRHLQKPYVRDLAITLVDQPPLYRAWLDPSWRHAGHSGHAGSISPEGTPR